MSGVNFAEDISHDARSKIDKLKEHGWHCQSATINTACQEARAYQDSLLQRVTLGPIDQAYDIELAGLSEGVDLALSMPAGHAIASWEFASELQLCNFGAVKLHATRQDINVRSKSGNNSISCGSSWRLRPAYGHRCKKREVVVLLRETETGLIDAITLGWDSRLDHPTQLILSRFSPTLLVM